MAKSKQFNQKILVMGLGVLGGGTATCLWLLKHGARLSITDSRPKKDLEKSLKKLKKYSAKVKFILGRHRVSDFMNNDVIVVNPGVKIRRNPYLAAARQAHKIIENEISLFFKTNKNPVIAVTGTRGKTTVSRWIGHFMNAAVPTVVGGNTADNPVLSFLDKLKKNTVAVLELSSFQLEILPMLAAPPHIAVITNLYVDHLNRHGNMKNYALAKANIFKSQKESDFLILNYDNPWTDFFLSRRPKGHIYFISRHALPLSKNGIFEKNQNIYFQENGKRKLMLPAGKFTKTWGEHNLENLLNVVLAVRLYGLTMAQIKSRIGSLPVVKFRQEMIKQTSCLTVINDSSATSPDATVAALNRFDRPQNNLILLTGGTDKNLDFMHLARKIKSKIQSKNLIILNGSASRKLTQELHKINYSHTYSVFEDLSACLTYASKRLKRGKHNIILFSPAAASFEKFRNEFDRGEKFNKLVKAIRL